MGFAALTLVGTYMWTSVTCCFHASVSCDIVVPVLRPVDDDLLAIAAQILRSNRTEAEWAAVESDDMFQRGARGARNRDRTAARRHVRRAWS